MRNDYLQVRETRADIVEEIGMLEFHRSVLARCPAHVDLHCRVELDELFVDRIEALVARIEMIVRGIELARVEAIALDATLDLLDGFWNPAERIHSACHRKPFRCNALYLEQKGVRRIGSGIVRA